MRRVVEAEEVVEVAGVVIGHPSVHFRERVVEVQDPGQARVPVAQDVTRDVDLGGNAVRVVGWVSGLFADEHLTGEFVSVEFSFAETAFTDVFDPGVVFLEGGLFDLVHPIWSEFTA